MLRPPHHLHSSLYKAQTVSFSPHHLSRRFTTNVLYKQQENESKLCPHLSWLLRSPHQHHSSCWKNRKSASYSRLQPSLTCRLSQRKKTPFYLQQAKRKNFPISPPVNMLQSPPPSSLILLKNIKLASFSPQQPSRCRQLSPSSYTCKWNLNIFSTFPYEHMMNLPHHHHSS